MKKNIPNYDLVDAFMAIFGFKRIEKPEPKKKSKKTGTWRRHENDGGPTIGHYKD